MTTSICKPNRTFRNAKEEVIRESLKDLLLIELPSKTASSDDIYLKIGFDGIDLVINGINVYGITTIYLNLTNPFMHIHLDNNSSSSMLIHFDELHTIRQF